MFILIALISSCIAGFVTITGFEIASDIQAIKEN